MNAAIHYATEAFDTSGPKLMGRHAAGEGFLRAFVRHGGVETLLCYAKTQRDFAHFEKQTASIAGGPRACRFIPYERFDALSGAGCLYHPAPGLHHFAWQRRFLGSKSYSLCGVTHTIATHGIMDAIGEMLLAPLESWDAVICTSRVAKATIERVQAEWAAYLDEKFGGRTAAALQFPVIPLGVDCDAFAPSHAGEKAGTELRQRLGIAKSDVVVLFAGRLSYHAKAHPMPMYLGLEMAAQRTGKRIHLIQAGRFANEPIKNEFVNGAKLFCPSVRAVFLDGRDGDSWAAMWPAADIFASLSDNIQETFGLAPVEAMAAGLPVVATDWDGYRDTVRDGTDGILIPTFAPPAGAGETLAVRHFMEVDNYDHYIGFASQCTGVDVRAAAEAFTALIGDAPLRKKMGEAGRARARESFDWRVIIAAYQALWDELNSRRTHGAESAPRKPGAPAYPLRDDPFAAFAMYPSQVFGPDFVVSAEPGADEAALERVCSLRMNTYAAAILAPAREMRALLDRIRTEGPIAVLSLTGEKTAEERAILLRSLGWLGKMGLVTIKPPGPVAG
jgi:starch synthase